MAYKASLFATLLLAMALKGKSESDTDSWSGAAQEI